MQIEKDYPPNYDRICECIPAVRKKRTIVFTYGPILFNPGGNPISPDLKAHEMTHTHQQGADPDGWWERYLVDTEFRLLQELEAYRAQYAHAKRFYEAKHYKWLLKNLARDLSSPMYGKLVDFSKARDMIRAGL